MNTSSLILPRQLTHTILHPIISYARSHTLLTHTFNPTRPNPLLLGMDPYRYFLRCLRMIKAPDLEQVGNSGISHPRIPSYTPIYHNLLII